jgi:putative endonuclease
VVRVRIGREGEERAVKLLRREGYRILARNYRCRHGEIDVVAFEQGEIVFVEVKSRQSREKGSALEAVTPAKQRKIARVAEQFLAERDLFDRPCRFDVVAVECEGACELVRGSCMLGGTA